jgi:hypothetical protein
MVCPCCVPGIQSCRFFIDGTLDTCDLVVPETLYGTVTTSSGAPIKDIIIRTPFEQPFRYPLHDVPDTFELNLVRAGTVITLPTGYPCLAGVSSIPECPDGIPSNCADLTATPFADIWLGDRIRPSARTCRLSDAGDIAILGTVWSMSVFRGGNPPGSLCTLQASLQATMTTIGEVPPSIFDFLCEHTIATQYCAGAPFAFASFIPINLAVQSCFPFVARSGLLPAGTMQPLLFERRGWTLDSFFVTITE